MATTPDDIDRWRDSRESQVLEFKEAKSGIAQEEIYRYCIALANEGGGHLVLGVQDKPPRLIVGSGAAADPIGMQKKILDNLGFHVGVEEVGHPQGRVVVFSIPSRPKGNPYSLKGAFLMRSGSSVVPMTVDRLKRILAEDAPDWLEEVSRSDLSEDHVVRLLDTQTLFELLERPYPAARTDVIDRLLQEKLLEEPAPGKFSIHRLGALLLARRLRDFPDVARKAPRVIVYSGAGKLDTRLDRGGEMGYAVGFQRLVDFVSAQLPQNEVIEDALRHAVKLVPEEAIRELVANALIHQDLLIDGASVLIEIYDDRVEISNPGTPMVSIDRLIDSHRSRNERLADVMRRLRICEEKGSGIDRVIHAVEVWQLPAPDFRADELRTTMVIFGPRRFEDMGTDDRVRACYQHCALRYVMSEYTTNESLRQRFNMTKSQSATASLVIKATMEAGLIKLDPSAGTSKRYSRYVPFWAGESF